MQAIDRENPLLELHDIETHNGEICLRGNLVVLNLNLSRMLNKKNSFLFFQKFLVSRKLFNINNSQ